MVHFDEPTLLQLLDGAACGAVGDTASFADGLPAAIAAVCFVVAAQQVTVDCKGYRRQLVRKDFSWEHDEWFLLHVLVLCLVLKKCPHCVGSDKIKNMPSIIKPILNMG